MEEYKVISETYIKDFKVISYVESSTPEERIKIEANLLQKAFTVISTIAMYKNEQRS